MGCWTKCWTTNEFRMRYDRVDDVDPNSWASVNLNWDRVHRYVKQLFSIYPLWYKINAYMKVKNHSQMTMQLVWRLRAALIYVLFMRPFSGGVANPSGLILYSTQSNSRSFGVSGVERCPCRVIVFPTSLINMSHKESFIPKFIKVAVLYVTFLIIIIMQHAKRNSL